MREQTSAGTRQPPSTRALQLISGRVPAQPASQAQRSRTAGPRVDVVVQADDGTIRIIEFHSDDMYVSVWEDERFLANLNRRGLCDWLAVPLAPASISVGRITLASTPGLGITLTLPGITAAPIPEDACTRLRQRLRP